MQRLHFFFGGGGVRPPLDRKKKKKKKKRKKEEEIFDQFWPLGVVKPFLWPLGVARPPPRAKIDQDNFLFFFCQRVAEPPPWPKWGWSASHLWGGWQATRPPQGWRLFLQVFFKNIFY
jgi:hypothetical protein